MPGDFEIVRRALTESRRRGLDFDHAWTVALAALEQATPEPANIDRGYVVGALAATREAWLAAYERRPFWIERLHPVTRERVRIDVLARASLDALRGEAPSAAPMTVREGRLIPRRETVLLG